MASKQHLTVIEGGETLTREISTDYANSFSHESGEFYGSQGLDPAFLAIAQRHIEDLYVFVGGDNTSNNLGVQCSSDNPEDENGQRWIRVLRLGSGDFRCVTTWLKDTLKSSVDLEIDRPTAKKMALELVFYESTADIIANAVYMQQHFDKYISDFDGMSPYFEAQFTIARQFLNEFGSTVPSKQEELEEYYNFKAGSALAQLEASYIRNNLAKNLMEAKTLTAALAGNYTQREKTLSLRLQDQGFRITPQKLGDIRERLIYLKPNNDVRSKLAEYVIGLSDD